MIVDGPALIILSLVCANIRNCHLPSSKVRALDVFLALSAHLTDEAKLDRMVPYIVDLLHDDAALVRASALRTLMQVLMLVTVITPSNAAIFPEYIIPAIAHLVRDPEHERPPARPARRHAGLGRRGGGPGEGGVADPDRAFVLFGHGVREEGGG